MTPDERLKHGRIIRMSTEAVMQCPNHIIFPDHYLIGGGCRCTDPTHDLMEKWGYVWNGKQWEAGKEDDDATR